MRRSPPSATLRSARLMRCESRSRTSRRRDLLSFNISGGKSGPRGRAPAFCGWDEQRGGWLDENGKPFEVVDHPSRKRLAAEAARDKFMDLRKYPVVYACLFPCCGRKFAGTDAARKHARQQHAVWLAALPAARGTDTYCRQVFHPMHIV